MEKFIPYEKLSKNFEKSIDIGGNSIYISV